MPKITLLMKLGLGVDVFNIEGDKAWEPILEPIKFTKRKGKTWEYYVKANRMEVALLPTSM
jgi:hypothetical protein